MIASSIRNRADGLDSRRPDDISLLAAFSQFFAVSRDMMATLETALSGIMRALDVTSAAVFLLDDEANHLVCQAALGDPALRGTLRDPNEGLIGRCLRRNTLEDGVEAASATSEIAIGQRSDRAVVYAPLATDGRPYGVIQVIDRLDGAPFDMRDHLLLQIMANLAALAVSNVQMAEALIQQEVTARELNLAAEIQRSLLPNTRPGESPVFGLNRPIRQVSGDFFDFFALPDQRIAFALGDVSGKGINAALLMAKAASLYRCLGKRTDDPATVLDWLNREIHDTASRGMFVTMVAGIYDPATGRLCFANAGHEPPLLRAPDHRYQAFPAEAPPLGLLPELTFQTREVDLAGGEFLIFSDGLTEFRYGSREELGVKGLIQMIEALSALPLPERLSTVLAELDQEGWRMRDDLTVLAIDDAWVRPDA
jgi:phosphoserine phosphatase RsbU/P